MNPLWFLIPAAIGLISALIGLGYVVKQVLDKDISAEVTE